MQPITGMSRCGKLRVYLLLSPDAPSLFGLIVAKLGGSGRSLESLADSYVDDADAVLRPLSGIAIQAM